MDKEKEARLLFYGHMEPLNPTCEKEWNMRKWKAVGLEIGCVLGIIALLALGVFAK